MRDESHRFEALVDEAAAAMTRGEPSARLRANVRARAASPSRGVRSAMLVPALVAAALAAVVGSTLWLRPVSVQPPVPVTATAPRTPAATAPRAADRGTGSAEVPRVARASIVARTRVPPESRPVSPALPAEEEPPLIDPLQIVAIEPRQIAVESGPGVAPIEVEPLQMEPLQLE